MLLQSANKKIRNIINRNLSTIIAVLILSFVLTFGILNNKIASGHYLWKRFHLERPAMFLASDASLALEIGNYYFNTYGDGIYDLAKAREYFNLALDLDPNVQNAWHQLARIDFLEGDFYNALKKINKQLEIHGDRLMPAYYVRGLIYGYIKDFKRAKKDLITFLKWDPKNWATHNDLSWIYFQMGDYKNTEKISREGLKWNQDNPWLLNALGVSLLNINSEKEARATLEKALENAKKITEKDWHNAYPGNNPAVARKGIQEIIKTIEFNLNLAVDN